MFKAWDGGHNLDMQYGQKREEAQGPTSDSKPAFRDQNEKEVAAKETKRSGQDLGRKN